MPPGVKIFSKLKMGAAGIAVDAVELTIAVSSDDSYRATLEAAEFIGKALGAFGGGLISGGNPLGVAGGSYAGGVLTRKVAATVIGSRDEFLQNQVNHLENSLTHTEAHIEEVELEMSRLTRGADDDSLVTEQGELDRLRQEYVDLQHQRDVLNDQIVHARTVLSADETFDYDADYGSTEAPTGETDLDDLEFRDWLEENHPDLSRHIDADGNLWSDPTAGNATDQGDAGVTRLAELNRELEAAREEYQEHLNPSDNDAANADGYILPTAEEAQNADNYGGGFSAVVKMYLRAA